LVAALVCLSALGPRAVSLGQGEIPDAPHTFPLYVALVIVGILPNFPVINQIEFALRRFAHERAFIPQGARAIAERIAAADFDFSQYSQPDIMSAPAMRGVKLEDFLARRGTLERNWAKLSCLLYRLRMARTSGESLNLDDEMLDRYWADVEQVATARRAVEEEVAEYRIIKGSDNFRGADELEDQIVVSLRKVYVLIGCAARLRSLQADDFTQTLEKFGFRFNDFDTIPSGGKAVVLTGAGIAALTAFFVSLLWDGWRSILQDSFGALLGMPIDAPIRLLISAFMAHGAAMLVVDRVRRRYIKRGKWYRGANGRRTRIGYNYIVAALYAWGTSAVILLAWSLLLTGPAWLLVENAARYALLPTVSGVFLAYQLDRVQLIPLRKPLPAILGQSLCSAFCAFIAEGASFGLNAGAQSPNPDYVVLMMVIAAAVGALLGWYLSKAGQRQLDQSSEEIRADVLKDVAVRRFGEVRAAEDWLKAPHSLLQGLCPANAAHKPATFEAALGLLEADVAFGNPARAHA
jgi:hypothetical protein